MNIMTYNFTFDDKKYRNYPDVIRKTLKDDRNNISVTDLVPGIQSYLNYLDLLLMYRNKWVSVGYLDLGMIPIIVGPSFMQQVLVDSLLPELSASGLKIYPMPGVSFMRNVSSLNITDYWVFRDDAAKFLGCVENRVSTRAIIEKVIGVDFE